MESYFIQSVIIVSLAFYDAELVYHKNIISFLSVIFIPQSIRVYIIPSDNYVKFGTTEN